MNYKIGNEIDHLGYAIAEADYRRERHTWRCCWFETITQIFVTLAIVGAIAVIFALLFGVYGQMDAAMHGYSIISY